MNRKFACWILFSTFALFFACARQEQQNQHDNKDDFTFYLTNDRSAIIIERYMGQQTLVVIPSVIEDMPVVKIGQRAFFGVGSETRLAGLSIPDTVIVIEREAFSHNRLESVAFGSNLTVIGAAAFAHNLLTELKIPESVIAIDVTAFMENNLESVSIPGSVAFIGVGAFMQNQLTEVSLAYGVAHIGNAAFAHNRLQCITIPGSVARIEYFAFENNPLAQISIGSGVELGSYSVMGHRLPSFDRDFDEFYFAHGRRAGIYTYSDGAWSVEFFRE